MTKSKGWRRTADPGRDNLPPSLAVPLHLAEWWSDGIAAYRGAKLCDLKGEKICSGAAGA